MVRWFVAATIAFAATGAVNAQGLGKVVTRQNNWELRKAADAFSDTQTCVITLAKKEYVQITREAISISYAKKGGAKSFEYRTDEEPTSGIRLPSKTERSLGFIILRGEDFAKVINSGRLRVKILTFMPSLVNEDIDMKGAKKLHDRMLSDCTA